MGQRTYSHESDYLFLPTFLLLCLAVVVVLVASSPGSQVPHKSVARTYRKVKKVSIAMPGL